MDDLGSLIFTLIYIALIVAMIAGCWKVFAKAGQPGWAIFIPFYNFYVMCQIAGRPGWWLLLLFIPLVNFVIAIIVAIDIARKFGQSAAFGIGLAFLGFIFYPILGFGDATYDANA